MYFCAQSVIIGYFGSFSYSLLTPQLCSILGDFSHLFPGDPTTKDSPTLLGLSGFIQWIWVSAKPPTCTLNESQQCQGTVPNQFNPPRLWLLPPLSPGRMCSSDFPKMWVTQPEHLVELNAPWSKLWSTSIKRRKGSKGKYICLLPFFSHPSKFSSKEQWYNKAKFSSKNSGTIRPNWKVPQVTGPKTKPCFLGDVSLCICPPSFPASLLSSPCSCCPRVTVKI